MMALPAPANIAAFTAAATLLTITPGLDTALVLRAAASDGPRKALLACWGVVLGLFGWDVIVAVGLGALIAASALAYDVLRWAGAAYLIHLAIRLLRRRTHGPCSSPSDATLPGGRSWLARGFLTNILNPRVGVFYVSFFPQFIDQGASVLPSTILLTGVHALLGLTWFAALIVATRPLLSLLRGEAARTWLDRVTAIVFVAFAVRLATSARLA